MFDGDGIYIYYIYIYKYIYIYIYKYINIHIYIYILLDYLNKANPLNVTLDIYLSVQSLKFVCFFLRLNPPYIFASFPNHRSTARASFATAQW